MKRPRRMITARSHDEGRRIGAKTRERARAKQPKRILDFRISIFDWPPADRSVDRPLKLRFLRTSLSPGNYVSSFEEADSFLARDRAPVADPFTRLEER